MRIGDAVVSDGSGCYLITVRGFTVQKGDGDTTVTKTAGDRHVDAVQTHTGRSPLSSEGVSQQQWILIDYGSVVVHVFDDDTRRFYEIERLYRDVPPVSWRLVG